MYAFGLNDGFVYLLVKNFIFGLKMIFGGGKSKFKRCFKGFQLKLLYWLYLRAESLRNKLRIRFQEGFKDKNRVKESKNENGMYGL